LVERLWGNPSLIDSDSLEKSTIQIEVKSSFIQGQDTIFLVQVTMDGMRREIHKKDTIVTDARQSFVDSILVTGSTISKSNDYRCPVFPVYCRHQIDMRDSGVVFKKAVFGTDTLGSVRTNGGEYYLDNATYLANVGFYHHEINSATNTTYLHELFSLKSFNRKIFTPVVLKPVSTHQSNGYSGNGTSMLRIFVEKPRSGFPGEIFLLNGRRSGIGNHFVPAPIILRKHSAVDRFTPAASPLP
jgi:hypothetical protein